MIRHPDTDRLQDYVDDLLCREERAELEAHLASCSQCAAAVRGERELRRALAALPRSITPERDLLAGINAAIGSGAEPRQVPGGPPAPRHPRSGRPLPAAPWRPRVFLAAALALIALTALVTSLLIRRADRPALARAVPTAPTDPMVREVLGADVSYRTAIAELEAALSPRTELDPATAALVARNLAVIDRALAEALAALRQEPENPALAQLLRDARAQKLELLRAATRGRT